MKGTNIFCASQASTAICLGMEEGSSSSSSFSSSNLLLSRSPAIDRYNPIIKDSRRIAKSLPPCSTPQPPISPKPYKKKNKKIPLKENVKKNDAFIKIKPFDEKKKDIDTTASKSWSCTKPGSFISPPGSTRYLLSEKVLFNAGPDYEPVVKSFHEENPEFNAEKTDGLLDQKPSSAVSSPEQVVILRVSLHCRGCERKMRKHLARMEGVSSFNIDFMAKKVTVMGKVTPLAVLSSISKVKNATLWSPTISSSSSSSNPSSSVLLKNEFKLADKEGVFMSMAT